MQVSSGLEPPSPNLSGKTRSRQVSGASSLSLSSTQVSSDKQPPGLDNIQVECHISFQIGLQAEKPVQSS